MKTNTRPLRKLRCALAAGIVASITAILLIGCGKKETATAAEPTAEASAGLDVEVHALANCPTGEGCFICDPAKRDAGRLWCKEHTRYEDRCWLCHPELEEEGRLYCGEHGVYEDECYLCHPELKSPESGASGEETSSTPKAEGGLFCNEHGVPEAECAICQPQLAAGLKPGETLKLRVASPEAVEKAGVTLSQPSSSMAFSTVSAYATVDYNRNRVAHITPLVEGIVQEIAVEPGSKIEAGETLGRIHSPAFAQAKSDFLAAAARNKRAQLQVSRERQLAEKRISAAADLETAEAEFDIAQVELSSARQRLINLHLSDSDIDLLAESGRPSAFFDLKAPFAGTIVDRQVAPGERVEPGDPILILADLSTRWLELSVASREAASLAPGMPVRALFAELPDTVIEALLIWISSAVDEKTRRVHARALVTDPPPALRQGLYGDAEIQIADPEPAQTVPNTSIQVIDGAPFVFVRVEPDLYAATRVDPATPAGGLTPIRSGLSGGEQIVTGGSYVLRSEFLKSLLGAGCVHD